jgi:hypothetical protein
VKKVLIAATVGLAVLLTGVVGQHTGSIGPPAAEAQQKWIRDTLKKQGNQSSKYGKGYGYNPSTTSRSCRSMARAQCIPCCQRKGYGADCFKQSVCGG